MATYRKRRNGDGSTSWDALVRVTGYPAIGKSFRSKLAAEVWASRMEAAAKGGSLAAHRGLTLSGLIGSPRIATASSARIVADTAIAAPSRARRPPCAITSSSCRACSRSRSKSCA